MGWNLEEDADKAIEAKRFPFVFRHKHSPDISDEEWIVLMTEESWLKQWAPWNPLEDENHFRQLQEKVMEDELLFYKVIMSMYAPHAKKRCCGEAFCYWQWLTATLPERVEALIKVLDKKDD